MSVKSKPSEPALSGLYLLLAELLHRELDPQLIELLLQPEIFDTFVKIEPDCEAYLKKEWLESHYETAAVEFCDLFILPESGTAPRAAAWLELGGDLTAESIDAVVSQFLTEWQVQVPTSYQYLATDHLSLMLYLYVVISEQDESLALEYQSAVLSPWIHNFADSLAESRSPIYKATAALLNYGFSEKVKHL